MTSGQIINRNAAWLSTRLSDLGFEVQQHLSVPDDRALILSALRLLSAGAQHVFVTGGLGPTTDDFTRDVIAEFAEKKLVFDSSELETISEILKKRGRTIKDSHKQQCFFPEGAQKLSNPIGTASGFSLQLEGCELFVLPGPPLELEGIWNLHLKKKMSDRAPFEKAELHTWNCIGLPEADLAEIVESTLNNQPFRKGYRLNAPFVEVKIWVDPKDKNLYQNFLPLLEKAIGPWVVFQSSDSIETLEAQNVIYPEPKLKNLRLRELVISDLKEYTLHNNRLFRERGIGDAIVHPFPRDKKWNFMEVLEKRSRRMVAKPLSPDWEITWGLFDQQKCFGHVCLKTGMIESDLHRLSLGIGIESPFWSLGYGTKLMSTAIRWARSNPLVDWIDLSVFSENKVAFTMYKKLGFQEIGFRADAFRIDGQSVGDHLMTLDVRSEEATR